MMKQRILLKNLGKDTHVRDFVDNAFLPGNSETMQMIAGEVLFPQPEPFYKQNMVTVRLARGGQVTNVAYPGAFIEPITGNIHGVYEGPIPGQMVMVGFENGNQHSPFVVNRYPYQGAGNSLTELSYVNPLSAIGFHAFDVVIGHFLGSYLSFNTGILPSTAFPGSVTLNAMTNLEIMAFAGGITIDSFLSCDISGTTGVSLSSIAGTDISGDTGVTISSFVSVDISGDVSASIGSSLGGAIETTALVKISTLTQSMGTLVQTLLTILNGFAILGPPAAVGVPITGVANPSTIALVTAEIAKWNALLEP